MAAIPSREVTTSEVAGVSFGFYTADEVREPFLGLKPFGCTTFFMESLNDHYLLKMFVTGQLVLTSVVLPQYRSL
jgi:hypothetical protein